MINERARRCTKRIGQITKKGISLPPRPFYALCHTRGSGGSDEQGGADVDRHIDEKR
jgi:hypothetical protein